MIRRASPDRTNDVQCDLQTESSRKADVKTCRHSDCALSLPTCCGCSDLRPQHSSRYQVYVDGQGMVDGDRWSFYCAACKDRLCEDGSDMHPSIDTDGILESSETQHSRRRARVLANYQRVFGTRDEIEDSDYESPLTSMFTRAWSRYQQHQSEVQDLISPPHEVPRDFAEVQILDEELEAFNFPVVRGRSVDSPVFESTFSREQSPAPLPDVDLSACFDAERPPPMHPMALINIECKICFTQVADVLLLPCAHLMMCSYCAPVIKLDGPREGRRDKCPICRGKVTRQIKVFR